MLREILTLNTDEDALLKTLYLASQKTTISYEEIVEIIGEEEIEDFLLAAEQSKLLLPVISSRSEAWKDKLLLIKPGEKYKMPNIIKILISVLYRKGEWNINHAITTYFKQIGESYWKNMPDFYKRIRQKAKNNKVNAQDIREVAREFNMEDRTGALIAELKGAGLISPFLKLAPANKLLYEINPSVREFP
ncbi:hypothetical protein J7K97_06070 [Candidatus Aerophobetes bacterium]|nr:hypothetical protein [Candidatus Aerophobetes bacterium]